MATDHLTSTRKALKINLDESIYGAFAEIGAGQEVARYFFTAGRASHTIAKTMSAYDMVISDAIYGKASRYVCEERLIKMLDHEYELLTSRLSSLRGEKTRFFTFADTVATSSGSTQNESARCHGWMGIRFQTHPEGPINDIILHVKMLDQMRLEQQNALGILGVNLIFAAFYKLEDPSIFVQELNDNLGSHRAEIDLLLFRGPDLQHIDNRELAMELVKQGLTKAILFGSNGQITQAADTLFKKPLVVHRGTFRPVTKINQLIMEKGLKQVGLLGDVDGLTPLPLMEITLKNMDQDKQMQTQDILQRVETLSALGFPVLISHYTLYYELKQFLRSCTNNVISFVIGASQLEKIFDHQFYQHLPGGLLQGIGQLFDEKAGLLVYPFKNKKICLTSSTFHPKEKDNHLYQYLIDNFRVLDMADCENIDTSFESIDVRKMWETGDDQWENFVPPAVAKIIREKNLFRNNE